MQCFVCSCNYQFTLFSVKQKKMASQVRKGVKPSSGHVVKNTLYKSLFNRNLKYMSIGQTFLLIKHIFRVLQRDTMGEPSCSDAELADS